VEKIDTAVSCDAESQVDRLNQHRPLLPRFDKKRINVLDRVDGRERAGLVSYSPVYDRSNLRIFGDTPECKIHLHREEITRWQARPRIPQPGQSGGAALCVSGGVPVADRKALPVSGDGHQPGPAWPVAESGD
jgi:hypothetical protein